MINQIYRLIGERKIEIQCQDEQINNKVVVRPLYLSICAADQRYYQGRRKTEIMEQKLPMALIHEAVGEVVYGNEIFSTGDKVVMIPNTPMDSGEQVKENYIEKVQFRSSNFDGYMQEVVFMDSERLIKIPDNNLDICCLLEPVSISVNAVVEFKKKFSALDEAETSIGIWGDGSVAYVTALVLRSYFPGIKLHVFGKNKDKLNYFTFVDETHMINRIPKKVRVNHAFECVGSKASAEAIEQIIALIKPQGCISLLGVSEDPVPINTRMILEKGLMLFGHSRSSKEDFMAAISVIEAEDVKEYLSKIIGDVIVVKTIEDIYSAFEYDINNPFKTILKWNV